MAIDFPSPSMRAAGGDLAIQVSPLGLIEISEEEFEVHGPRIIRYANNWAFYLGHHWMYRKMAGEEQLTFNHVKALSDFMTNFTFSKGVTFKVDKMFQHITPALLDRIFDKDNNRQQFLWSLGQQGGVSGDAFVKVAYAEAGQDGCDPITKAGRVCLLVLQPSHCFPEWHPHIPGKMTKFKLKYKFWGTQPDGTRVVNTYVEEITDSYIKEWLNDELIRENENVLGTIPVVHIANTPVSGSPWGLGDVDGVIPLNREYNEKATEISEIINYHVAPVTIVTGGKPPNLEKGPAKIWGIPNEKASVFNLEGGAAGLAPAMEFLEMLRMRMHEYGHVPANALGEPQPVSNTSGVALAIQYMPTMQWNGLKHTQYGTGLQEIAKLGLMTLFMKEPESLLYNPNTDGIIDEQLGQQTSLDPMDPAVYDIEVAWPAPLPTDIIIKLEEIERKMALNLESRKGAMRELGEEFPDEKLLELEEELMNDAKINASLTVFKAQVAAAIMALTGIVPPEMGEPVAPEAPEPGASSTTANAPQQVTRKAPEMPDGVQMLQQQIIGEIVTNAFMPRVPLRRQVDKNDSGND
jgi:SPP1 Gp6-like portal protein